MSASTVCVLGGTGFVGSRLCAELVKRGHRVRILSRHRERCRDLLVLPGTQIVECDVHDTPQLSDCVRDCKAVINLVGILNEKGHKGEGFRRVHVELAHKVIEACRNHKIPRLLHMSALNASPEGGSFYSCTKGEAENYVHTAGNQIAVTSFRPSVIFGPQDNFLNRFAALLKLAPGIFPLACADTMMVPVYVGDVASAMTDALGDPETYGSRIDLCGPKRYTLKQLVDYTAELSGTKTKVLGLPKSLSKLQAHFFEFIPGKPFSVDNYRSLQTHSICPGGEHCSTPLETIAPSYLLDQSRDTHHERFRSQR